MNVRLALVLLVTMAAQGQTLHTCGTKPNQVPCLSVNSCVYSPSTGKKYCGATMAAAEAQAMSHEPQTIQASDVPLFDWDCIGNNCSVDGGVAYSTPAYSTPAAEALVCAIDGVSEDVIIPYCDQVLGTDDECVMRKGQWKKFQNDVTHKQRDFSVDDSLEHEALIALGECLQRERNK